MRERLRGLLRAHQRRLLHLGVNCQRRQTLLGALGIDQRNDLRGEVALRCTVIVILRILLRAVIRGLLGTAALRQLGRIVRGFLRLLVRGFLRGLIGLLIGRFVRCVVRGLVRLLLRGLLRHFLGNLLRRLIRGLLRLGLRLGLRLQRGDIPVREARGEVKLLHQLLDQLLSCLRSDRIRNIDFCHLHISRTRGSGSRHDSRQRQRHNFLNLHGSFPPWFSWIQKVCFPHDPEYSRLCNRFAMEMPAAPAKTKQKPAGKGIFRPVFLIVMRIFLYHTDCSARARAAGNTA